MKAKTERASMKKMASVLAQLETWCKKKKEVVLSVSISGSGIQVTFRGWIRARLGSDKEPMFIFCNDQHADSDITVVLRPSLYGKVLIRRGSVVMFEPVELPEIMRSALPFLGAVALTEWTNDDDRLKSLLERFPPRGLVN
jgi:hypothetical protein